MHARTQLWNLQRDKSKQAIPLYDQGLSVAEASSKLGVGVPLLLKTLKTAGVWQKGRRSDKFSNLAEKVSLVCPQCGVTFSKSSSDQRVNIKKGYTTYCSTACWRKSKERPDVSLVCPKCGVTFFASACKHSLALSRGYKTYCSAKCSYKERDPLVSASRIKIRNEIRMHAESERVNLENIQKEKARQAIPLYQNGMSVVEASRMLGVSCNNVLQELKLAGVWKNKRWSKNAYDPTKKILLACKECGVTFLRYASYHKFASTCQRSQKQEYSTYCGVACRSKGLAKLFSERNQLDRPQRIARSKIKHKLFKVMQDAVRRRVKNMARGKVIPLFSCTHSDLLKWLQFQFKKGMHLNNYGKAWQVDHIIPCAAFDLTNETQQRLCFHYSNLRPLSPSANHAKGARMEAASQLPLLV